MIAEDVDELETAIQEVQQAVCEGWTQRATFQWSYRQAGRILKKAVEDMMEGNRSGAALLFGSEEDIQPIVDAVMDRTLCRRPAEGSVLAESRAPTWASIDGNSYDADNEALIDIANQFIFNRTAERQLQPALEDLEEYLRTCHVERAPAVIVVHNFQVFIKKRQTFIYTLLDLMHNQDMFFIVLLHSASVDINNKLEKRVLSRLNAQSVMVPRLTTEDLCVDLLARMLPHHFGDGSADLEDRPVKAQYIARYEESLKEVLGNFEFVAPSTTAAAAAAAALAAAENEAAVGEDAVAGAGAGPRTAAVSTSAGDAAGGSGVDAAKGVSHQHPIAQWWDMECKLVRKGSLSDVLKCLIDGGVSRREFEKVALTVLTSLSPTAPVPTKEMFTAALEGDMPISLPEVLQSLNQYELTLYAVIARHSILLWQTGKVNNREEVVVDDVLGDFDKLTSLLSKKEVPMNRVAAWFQMLVAVGLIQLWNGQRGTPVLDYAVPSAILPTTVITVMHFEGDIQATFSIKRPENWLWRRVRPAPGLVLSGHIRRAVLEPLVPLMYSVAGSANLESVSL